MDIYCETYSCVFNCDGICSRTSISIDNNTRCMSYLNKHKGEKVESNEEEE